MHNGDVRAAGPAPFFFIFPFFLLLFSIIAKVSLSRAGINGGSYWLERVLVARIFSFVSLLFFFFFCS